MCGGGSKIFYGGRGGQARLDLVCVVSRRPGKTEVAWQARLLISGGDLLTPSPINTESNRKTKATILSLPAWWHIQDGRLGPLLRTGWRGVMTAISRFAIQRPPSTCAHCGEPFKEKENHLYAWRSSSGKLYCSEFCADDEEEATFQNMRRATAV
jgi:hypothetical protein